MKEPKRKNKENLIGKIIYGFLLFMPLLAMAITCAYAIFNKNAYQSYYAENINQVQYKDVSSNEQISSEKTYYFYGGNATSTDYSGTIYYTNCEYVTGSSTITDEQIEFVNNSVRLYYYRGTSVTVYDNENNSLALSGLVILKLNGLLGSPTSTNTFKMIKEVQYNNLSYVSEVFYYSVDKVEQSNLFNWSKETGMYTTVHGATELLGITNTFIPMLMSYWLLISVIYIVYDIALIGVHMVHNKIHDFENVM